MLKLHKINFLRLLLKFYNALYPEHSPFTQRKTSTLRVNAPNRIPLSAIWLHMKIVSCPTSSGAKTTITQGIESMQSSFILQKRAWVRVIKQKYKEVLMTDQANRQS